MTRRGKVRKGEPDPPFGVVGCAPNLLNGDGDLEELCQQIEEFRAACGLPVRIIVVDTVHACAPGSREDAADSGAMLANIRALMERFGCAAFLVDHSGKDSSRGARGSNSKPAAADVVIEIVEADGVRTPVVHKVRDGEKPVLEPFVIEPVMFGLGTDDQVSVGVHELTEPAPGPDAGDPRKAKAREMRAAGSSFEAIGKALGISKTLAWKWCHGGS